MQQTQPITAPYKGLGTVVNVLIGLYDEKRIMMSDIEKYADKKTGKKILFQLLEKNLVTHSVEDKVHVYANWFELTDKGQKVAALLKEANNIIEND